MDRTELDVRRHTRQEEDSRGSIRLGRAEIATAVTVAAGYVLLLAARTEEVLPGHPRWSKPYDHQKYILMAEQPFDLRVAPFSWRILEPLIAHLSPLSLTWSFRLLVLISVSGTLVATYVLIRRLGHAPHLALAGMLLLASLGWVTTYPVSNIWLPDAPGALFIVLAAIAALDRRPVAFALLLLVGALIKEQVLFAAPLWYMFARRDQLLDWRLLRQMVGLALPALGALMAVRLALPAENGDPQALAQFGLDENGTDHLSPDPVELFSEFGTSRLPTLPIDIIAWSLAAFGVCCLLALATRANLRVLAVWAPFLLVVFMQPLVAYNTVRLVALAFPVFIIAAVGGLERIQERLQLHDLAVVAVGAVVALRLLMVEPDPETLVVDAELLIPTLLVVGVLALGWAATKRQTGREHPRGGAHAR